MSTGTHALIILTPGDPGQTQHCSGTAPEQQGTPEETPGKDTPGRNTGRNNELAPEYNKQLRRQQDMLWGTG